VRRLSALIDRQPCFRNVPVRHDRARLKRHAGVSTKNELRFYHLVRIGEGLVDITSVVIPLEGKIVAEGGMDDGR
jgi:hypothetical protein